MPRPPRSRLRRAAAAGGAALVLLLALEGALRLGGWHERSGFFRFQNQVFGLVGDPDFLRVHPTRFFELAPGLRQGPEHAGRFATADWPYRGPAGEPAPPDLARVAVIGDSRVYGVGLAVAETLPARIQRGLEAAGFPAESVQVLGFGVPGYSTVQLADLLDEVLREHRPRAVVLQSAAWNDQTPALWLPDRALFELRTRGLRPWLGETALFGLVEHLLGGAQAPPELDPEEVARVWDPLDPPNGYRVPEAEVEDLLRSLLERCRAAGVPAVLIVPAYPQPAAMREQHPAAVRNSDRARAVARAAGVPLVDAPALLAASGLSEAETYLDFAHLSPTGVELLAQGVAGALAPLLQPPPRPPRSPPVSYTHLTLPTIYSV